MIHESDTDDAFESIYTTTISNLQKSSGKGSNWITDSVINHNINTSNYIQKRGLINVQNIDDMECFKRYLVR